MEAAGIESGSAHLCGRRSRVLRPVLDGRACVVLRARAPVGVVPVPLTAPIRDASGPRGAERFGRVAEEVRHALQGFALLAGPHARVDGDRQLRGAVSHERLRGPHGRARREQPRREHPAERVEVEAPAALILERQPRVLQIAP